MPELAGLLLAAGESRRLGQPKQLVIIDDEPLVLRQARQLRTACAMVRVVVGAHADPVRRALGEPDFVTIENPDWKDGLASSLRAGIQSLPRGTEAVMVLLCDQYAVRARHLQALRATWEACPEAIAAACWDEGRGAPAIFPRALFGQLESLQGDRGARALLREHESSVRWLNMPEAALDLDQPKDLARLRKTQPHGP